MPVQPSAETGAEMAAVAVPVLPLRDAASVVRLHPHAQRLCVPPSTLHTHREHAKWGSSSARTYVYIESLAFWARHGHVQGACMRPPGPSMPTRTEP